MTTRQTGDGFDAVAPLPYTAIDTHDDLVAWSRAYAAYAVDAYGMAVDLDRVDWAVSTRAKRRAAAVKQARIPDASVGVPVDWDRVVREHGPAYADRHDADPGDVRRCTVVLTWAAYEAYDRTEWTETLRHELVHVEQFQRYAATGHGDEFKRRARAVDAGLRCRTFATAKYRVTCEDCGKVVARRYRACRLTREPGRHRSRCCGAPVAVERVESGND
ncbi:SprT-like domain-containing protein [Halobacteriaceae archaeon GCM10025711]